MRSRVYRFESEDIVVTWDYMRCIHVEACVRGLPEVFNRDRRPWIDPSLADADHVATVCEQCPTGALHYERKDGRASEATPDSNTISISSDGPLYASGDVRIADSEGETLLHDTRVALCRCGQSRNKPLCDGSHEKAAFRADSTLTPAALAKDDGDAPAPGELLIRATENGPLSIRGSAQIKGDQDDTCLHVRVGALCCCGKSKNKPFCDGSHASAPS